ncbi:MAG: hypothetical protein K0S55_772 [Clostridia bacterium]|jgi:hypothetical protein|nr:hypothetical protein [Clostridia bacterium]
MKLFHVSEESDIKIFEPRKPVRKDMQSSPPLVWTLNEKCLPNFLTPRDCPRVTYHVISNTTKEDKQKYLSSHFSSHVVAIEQNWFERMKNTVLYIYEFDAADFYLQDEIAGYYVSEKVQIPKSKIVITDLFAELFNRNVELRLLPEIITLRDEIIKSSFAWSMCRMANAKKFIEKGEINL